MSDGNPITLNEVLKGDKVRITRVWPSGYKEIDEGVVDCLWFNSIIFDTGANLNRPIDAITTGRSSLTILLLHRPPRRVEISKEDLILKTPIGTKVEMVQNNGGIIHGTLWATGRTGDGLCVYLGPDRFDAAEVDLDNIKAIYTEVQG